LTDGKIQWSSHRKYQELGATWTSQVWQWS